MIFFYQQKTYHWLHLTTGKIFNQNKISSINLEIMGNDSNLPLAQLDSQWATECKDTKITTLAAPVLAANKRVIYFLDSPRCYSTMHIWHFYDFDIEMMNQDMLEKWIFKKYEIHVP